MNNTKQPKVSIVVLTYSRPNEIKNNIEQLLLLTYPQLEIIVVDNASEIPAVEILPEDDRLTVIRLDKNIGVGGRNAGILKSSSEFVITLDDDVTGMTDESIVEIINQFKVEDIAAVNFKVIDEKTKEITNWCHHRKQEIYADKSFDTYEISEGAVAFRKNAVIGVGLYPEFFFISHEGPDLAIRLMDNGKRVVYCPEITVKHSHCQTSRTNWRRYYYDTRNVIWFSLRSFGVFMVCKKIFVGVGAMFIYSVRDGYFKYWFKGVWDAIMSLRMVLRKRKMIRTVTLRRYKEIEAHNPNLTYMIKKRIFKRNISI